MHSSCDAEEFSIFLRDAAGMRSFCSKQLQNEGTNAAKLDVTAKQRAEEA
jgi:hypothetical protein